MLCARFSISAARRRETPPIQREVTKYGGAEKMKEKRVKVTLVCSECNQRNYDTAKNKSNTPDRLENIF